ncbi:metallophosphatase, partial [Mesorhizobium sp. M2C.T.Ca.TU.002.02.1.1]
SILIVDVSADAATRGRIAAYRQHFFMRLADKGHERLVPVEALDGALKHRVAARLEAIFPMSQA